MLYGKITEERFHPKSFGRLAQKLLGMLLREGWIVMTRKAELSRKTKETVIDAEMIIEGRGVHKIKTGIPFFDHMLTLMTVHGFFDMKVQAKGDIEVDFHHTIEDVGLVLGEVLNKALGDRKGIQRYGHAVTPMDETIAMVTIDLSKRPFLVFRMPPGMLQAGDSFTMLSKEFFRALATRGGMNLHIDVPYGENEHHMLEAVFKAAGRALDAASSPDQRLTGVLSTKGAL
jgi:imidazoleglycerol-phosphate dehydratase